MILNSLLLNDINNYGKLNNNDVGINLREKPTYVKKYYNPVVDAGNNIQITKIVLKYEDSNDSSLNVGEFELQQNNFTEAVYENIGTTNQKIINNQLNAYSCLYYEQYAGGIVDYQPLVTLKIFYKLYKDGIEYGEEKCVTLKDFPFYDDYKIPDKYVDVLENNTYSTQINLDSSSSEISIRDGRTLYSNHYADYFRTNSIYTHTSFTFHYYEEDIIDVSTTINVTFINNPNLIIERPTELVNVPLVGSDETVIPGGTSITDPVVD